jgi:hypothetical protein
MIAPAMLPSTLAAIIFSNVARGTSISERNEPVDASDPSHIATLFVALAETDGKPTARSVGNEMKLPPPAAALIALATNPANAIARR